MVEGGRGGGELEKKKTHTGKKSETPAIGYFCTLPSHFMILICIFFSCVSK